MDLYITLFVWFPSYLSLKLFYVWFPIWMIWICSLSLVQISMRWLCERLCGCVYPKQIGLFDAEEPIFIV